MWKIESRLSLANLERVDYYWHWTPTNETFRSYLKALSCLTAKILEHL